MSKLLSVQEACEVLEQSETTVKRYAKENLITSTEENGEMMFKEEDVMKYLEFQKRFAR